MWLKEKKKKKKSKKTKKTRRKKSKNIISEYIYMNIGLSLGSAAMSALLGRQILSQAITDASCSIYSSVGEVFHHTGSIDKVLCELDINNKVKTIELLCNQLPKMLKDIQMKRQ